MAFKILGGSSIDGNITDVTTDTIECENDRVLYRIIGGQVIQYYLTGQYQGAGGELMALGNYLNPVSYASIAEVLSVNGLTGAVTLTASDISSDDGTIQGDIDKLKKWSIDQSATLTVNTKTLSNAIGGNINRALPEFVDGDFLIVNLSPQSDSNMIIPVTGVTIYGGSGSLVDGDNLILQAGDTLHLAAESETILRIV